MRLVLSGFVGKFVSNVHQENDNQQKCGCNLAVIADCYKVVHLDKCFSMITVMSRKIIPHESSLINKKVASNFPKSAKFGVIIATPNQIPEMFIDKDESDLSQYLGIFSTKASLIGGQMSVNQILGRTQTLSPEYIEGSKGTLG